MFEEIVLKKLGRLPTSKDKQEMLISLAFESKRSDLQASMVASVPSDMTDKTQDAVQAAAADYAAEGFTNKVFDRVLSAFSKQPMEVSKGETFKLKVPKPFGLKLKSNQPISAPNLARVLNSVMHVYVKRLMGQATALGGSPYFKFDSGRFAGSVRVLGVDTESVVRAGRNTSIYFTYLVQPYATYEGNPRGYGSPSNLGREAIRAAMLDTLHKDSIQSLNLSDFNKYINRGVD